MLMKSIGLLGVSAAEESDEIKPEYLQEAAMKIVSDEVRREIVAYVHGGGDEGAATLTHLINSYAIPTLAVYDGVLTDEDKGKIVTRLCEVTNDAIKAAKEITEISGGNLTMLAYEPIENWPRIVRQYRQADKLRNSTARTE